jgi:hypothetical protein
MAIKFDGTKFKNGSTVVGNLYNDKIYEGAYKSKVLCNVSSGKIYEGAYKSKILITIKDAQKNVDGNMNDATVAAAWLMLA